MNTSESDMQRWSRIAAELRAYREKLRETWGELDDVVLANYCCDTATSEERTAIESAMRERPAIRELVEMVRDSLRPAWVAPASVATGGKRLQVLRESLQVWLDDGGRLVSQGVEYLMRPSLTMAADLALGVEAEEARWQIPLDPLGCELTVTAHPGPSPGKWLMSCNIVGDVNPEMVARIWFSLGRQKELPIVQAELAKFAGRSLEIDEGVWELRVEFDDEVRVLPIVFSLSPVD